ncbi:MAG: hypothetical protein ACE5JH_01600 [Acidobacteriota bacterium]
MQQLLAIVGVLILLLLVMRVSLARRGKSFALPGGVTALNLATGALAGAAAAVLAGDLGRRGGAGLPGGVGGGYALLHGALLSILPFAGVVLGAMAGYFLWGGLWSRLVRGGGAAARAWLRRSQWAAIAAALLYLILRRRV